VRVTLVVHEHKRLGRGIDLATLAEQLKAHDVGLESLTTPASSRARTTPPAWCSPCRPRCPAWNANTSAAAPMEGHESARRRGKTIGGAGVTDPDMLAIALQCAARN
jgi:hypothetical protein